MAFCISKNKLELASSILEAGSPAVGWKYNYFVSEQTLLHCAIQEGFEELAILMVEKHPECLKQMDFVSNITGKSPLIEAVDKGFSKLLKVLLQTIELDAAVINYKNPKSSKNSALSIATEDNNREIINLLLKAGAH